MSTGTETGPARVLSTRDQEAVYRPISSAAILSIVLAILSIGAFASWVLWFIPPIALLVSARSSTFLDQAKQEYAGQLVAKFALVLSLLSFLGAPTQYYTQKFIICQAAQKYADEYLDLILTNHLKTAFCRSVHPAQRHGIENDEDKILEKLGQRYRDFLQSDVVVSLKKRGNDAQVTKGGVAEYQFTNGFFLVVVTYRVNVDDRNYDVALMTKGGVAVGGDWEGRKWFVEGSHMRPL